jgi:hypothetical protein
MTIGYLPNIFRDITERCVTDVYNSMYCVDSYAAVNKRDEI